MTNVNATVKWFCPVNGGNSDGEWFGSLAATNKAAQDDTITITNATSVSKDETLLWETTANTVRENITASTNVITCASANTGTLSGYVVGKPIF